MESRGPGSSSSTRRGHDNCIVCRRRILDKKKKRVGAPSIWSTVREYGESKGLTLNPTDRICHPCYLKFYNRNQKSIKPASLQSTNLRGYFEPPPPKDSNLESVSSAGMSGYLSTQSSATFDSVSLHDSPL
jgi:hypothetical protein